MLEAPAPLLEALQTETAPPLSAPIPAFEPSDRVQLGAGFMLKHYEILRKLGKGGMGSVFLARDTRLGRLVAIKVLLKHAGERVARFLAEAQATARCKHENIVVIYGLDELRGTPFMVLEYLEGRTLRDLLVLRSPPEPRELPGGKATSLARLSPSAAVELMLPVVRALGCAHQRGIVHRDLKPENIVLTDTGRIVVLDFGIAKRLDAREVSMRTASGDPAAKGAALTQAGALLGTLPYMSPEQWRREEIDPRSDLWAVGIILYELLTGAHPLAPLSMLRLAQVSKLDEPMPAVREQCADVGALGAVIDGCLKKRKAERIGSAEELLDALEPLRPGCRMLERSATVA